MVKKYQIFILLSLCNASCMTSKKIEKKNENYSYDYTENGCKTGAHSFSDLASYCKALQNEDLNNGCAGKMRNDAFSNQCQNLPAGSQNIPPGGPSNNDSEWPSGPSSDGTSNQNQLPTPSPQNGNFYWYERCISGIQLNSTSAIASATYTVSFACSNVSSSPNLSEAAASQSSFHASRCPKSFNVMSPMGQSCTFSTTFTAGTVSNVKSTVESSQSTDASNCSPKTTPSLAAYGSLVCK